jgi:hypothetical protein
MNFWLAFVVVNDVWWDKYVMVGLDLESWLATSGF